MTTIEFFKKFFLKILLQLVLTSLLVLGNTQHQLNEPLPEFLQGLQNHTATKGRDVSYTCIVNNLGPYRVAWIKSDSKAILAIHTLMVALNPRLSVTHNGHNTWKLHIANVQVNDSGSYMCQVNTDPMRSQLGFLDVVVPPDILNDPDAGSMDEGITNEGGQIQLVCIATGVPPPTTSWRREGGKDIILRSDGRDKQIIKQIEGERLVLHQVQRTDMGGYMCIASNGIPPTVSKRYDVQVNFPPTVKAVNQLVGAPAESHVVLECIAEVFPKALNGWYRNDGAMKLHDGPKYLITERLINSYIWQLNLTIRNIQKADFGEYTCTSVNALGKQDARIRLQELRLPPKPTTTTTPLPFVYTTQKPRRNKQHQNYNHKGNHESSTRGKESNRPIVPENEIGPLVIGSDVFTQLPGHSLGSNSNPNVKEKNRNVQSAFVTTRSPHWIYANEITNRSARLLTNCIDIIWITIICIAVTYSKML